MEDGLYISGKWVCDPDTALTFQGNDLTQPDARSASFSNTFTLPDSLTVRDLTQGAEQIDAVGKTPYLKLPARVLDQGEEIFSGFIEFVSSQAGWKVNLVGSLVNFWDAIKDKQLTELDLARLNHPWTLDYITAHAGSSDGVVYPLIDYGGIDEGTLPYDTMCPAVYAKTVFGQICKEAGYRPVGDWLNDPLLLALALPFVNADPKAHDDQWVEDRTAKVTVVEADPIHLEDGHPINVILPLAVDNRVLDGYYQGKLRPFNTSRYAYVCPSRMRLKVAAQVLFISITRIGAAEVKLILEKNGQPVGEAYFSKGGYYDRLDQPDTLQIDESVDCLAGDELTLRLTGSARTDFADYSFYFSMLPDDTWASFTPDPLVHLGDEWPVATNLPSMGCKDLVLSIAQIMQGTYEVDERRKTVKLVPLDDVVKNIPNAVDWSANVDESVEPVFTVQFDGYTARNWCKWKEHDDKAFIGYGDGYLGCSNTANPTDSTLFELPFMAAVKSENVVGGYGAPILIKTRSIKKSGDTISIDKNDAAPRLILIEPSKTFTVLTKTATIDGDIVTEPVTLTGCWWAIRPDAIKTDANGFSLAFSPVTGQGEQPLFSRYFNALKRVLRRPRMLEPLVYLQPMDIANLDLSIPIRLKAVRIGSLDINDNLFYLNKLGPYRSGMSCTATLIAL